MQGAHLHCFDVVAHVEVRVAKLAVDGAQGPEVVSSGLETKLAWLSIHFIGQSKY